RVSSLLLRPRLASSFTRRPRAPAPTLFPYTTLFRSRAEPARYGLLYGGPVPGYAAPPERTTGPGTRVIRVLTAIVTEADAAGLIPAPAHPPAPALSADAERIGAELGSALSATALSRALTVWTGRFGAVGFEVFGQYGPGTFADPDAVLYAQVSALAGLIGL